MPAPLLSSPPRPPPHLCSEINPDESPVKGKKKGRKKKAAAAAAAAASTLDGPGEKKRPRLNELKVKAVETFQKLALNILTCIEA